MRKLKRITKAIICMALVFTICMTPMQANAAPIATGIDVSKYQGAINWQAVKSSGVSFAFVRVGTTKKGIDPTFATNIQGAAAAGLRTGVYIYSYATNAAEAVAEANAVLQSIAPYTVSFPVVIDIEDTVHKSLSPIQQAEIVNTFCSIIQSAGYYPMVYASKNWFVGRMAPVPYDKWVAQYGSICEYPNPAVWQYSCTGSVPGIAGNVDMNYLFKDYASLIIANGFTTRNAKTYYYSNYRMRTGWVDADGGRYFFNPAGEMQTGWITNGVISYYFQPAGGKMQTGFADIEGSRYYFNDAGLMQVGLVDVGTGKYFFDNAGKMKTGWINTGITSFYFRPDGTMVTGWTDIDGHRYYFKETGEMSVGLTKIGDKTYLFDADGTMKTGWIGNDQVKFFFLSDGTMATGWQSIAGGMYYFKEDGTMNRGLLIQGNSKYYNDEATGLMVTGWKAIGARWFLFGPDGILITNATIDVNGTLCQFDANGVLVAPVGFVPVQ
ncbi:MAG: GH25 family lysozyme [Lachnospiraceae bacterium]